MMRKSVAAELLGLELDGDGYATCPGEAMHTHRTGRRDFRVILEGAPTGYCFHSNCTEAVEKFNHELRRRIGKAEAGGDPRGPSPLGGAMPPPPQAARSPKRPPFDPHRLADFAARAPAPVSVEWLVERSPVAVPPPSEQGPQTAAAVLGALYGPGERVLAFTRQWSQGDFLWTDGNAFRLAECPGVAAVPSPLPDGGPEGCWFLSNPVVGGWRPNPGNLAPDGTARLGRRHGACVTAWRFLVLESDEAEAGQWVRALAQLPLPIVAAYTSGGRSIHALVRVDARTKEEFDALRDELLPILCPLGADPAAMTAVRLTRLPGTLRHGTRTKGGKVEPFPRPQLQRLLWLNPGAPAAPILDLVQR